MAEKIVKYKIALGRDTKIKSVETAKQTNFSSLDWFALLIVI